MIASLNIENTTWDPLSTAYLPMQLYHHNGYYDRENKRYIILADSAIKNTIRNSFHLI